MGDVGLDPVSAADLAQQLVQRARAEVMHGPGETIRGRGMDHGTTPAAYAGNISGVGGGLTKIGTGTLELSGTNTATGLTLVDGGAGSILMCDSSLSLGAGPLSITNLAILNLNYVGDRTVASLTLDGVAQPAGTYGSSASPATTMDDVHFAGTGTVTVSAGGPAPPVALFTATPTNGVRPLVVTFTDLSTVTGAAITNRFWNFGDATTTNTTATNVVHTYATEGTKTVTLIVISPDGSGTNIQTGLITVTVPNPPNVTSVKNSGSNVILTGNGGPTGGGYSYFVLTSTNVVLPIASWTTNAQVGVFDGSGNFVYTNAMTPGAPKQFFRLKMP